MSVTLVAALAGCDGGEPKSEPSRSPDSSAASGSESTSASSAPSAQVTPADGPLIEGKALSFHLPAAPDWDTSELGSVKTGGRRDESGLIRIMLGDLATTSTDLDSNAKDALDIVANDDPAPKRIENRVVNGVECWVANGANEDDRLYVVGGLHNGYQFSIIFDIPADWAEADQRIEEVLASVEWK